MQAVFFDADGVLYYRQHRRQHLRSFLQQHHLPLPDQEALWQTTREIYIQASCGAIEQEALYLAVLEACHVNITDSALRSAGCQALTADDAAITLFEGVAETLPALKARGFRLGVITDTAAPTPEKLRWLREQGLDIAWDAFASSRDIGIRKPDPRIYEAALKQCAVKPNQAAFVGHSARELAGARAVGLVTVAFNADPDAKADYFISRFADLLELSILRIQ
jgi:HAD superfamily hydrolase (TIGR01509 family)